MFEVYTKALAVLDVLEDTVRRIKYNQRFRLTATLRRKGLLDEKSIVGLMDALNPNQANRFYVAMATIESNFARLDNDDKYFMETEGPAATGFYMAYLEQHDAVIDRAYRILIRRKKVTPGVDELDDVANTLCGSPTWVAKVLIPSVDPLHSILVQYQLKRMICNALQNIERKSLPVPHQVKTQLMKLNLELPEFELKKPMSTEEKASLGFYRIRINELPA